MTKCLDLDQVGSFDVADKLFKEDINDFGKKSQRLWNVKVEQG